MPGQPTNDQHRSPWWLATLLLLACGDASPPADESDTGGTESWMPAECKGLSSPFLEVDCMTGLQTACRALASEQACTSVEPLIFEDGAYVIHCGWAKIVSFTDIDTCTVAEVTGRCEAGIAHVGIGCADRCAGEMGLYSSLSADDIALEMIEMPCAPAGSILDGPLGPSSAVGSDVVEDRTCALGVDSPPDLCACHSDACEAL